MSGIIQQAVLAGLSDEIIDGYDCSSYVKTSYTYTYFKLHGHPVIFQMTSKWLHFCRCGNFTAMMRSTEIQLLLDLLVIHNLGAEEMVLSQHVNIDEVLGSSS